MYAPSVQNAPQSKNAFAMPHIHYSHNQEVPYSFAVRLASLPNRPVTDALLELSTGVLSSGVLSARCCYLDTRDTHQTILLKYCATKLSV